MTIQQAISNIKSYHKGEIFGKPIDEEKTRDKVLYGDDGQELKGIVTTCFASVDVIRKAGEMGANLIISHEALFWNHGDHTDWLQDNQTFQAKTTLLDQYGIVVWRDHDYIHSGIPLENGIYTDGIFYGLMMELGWKEYLTCNVENPLRFTLPKTTVRGLGEELKQKLNLRGIKVIGSPDSPVRSVWVPGHIDGREDNQILQTVEEENIDTIITLECTDYTVAEYVRDSTMAGRPKTILAVGHFNSEEPGMRYMVQYLPQAAQTDVPCLFIPSTDMYHFI